VEASGTMAVAGVDKDDFAGKSGVVDNDDFSRQLSGLPDTRLLSCSNFTIPGRSVQQK